MVIALSAVCISGTPLGVQCALDSLINISLLKECQAKCNAFSINIQPLRGCFRIEFRGASYS